MDILFLSILTLSEATVVEESFATLKHDIYVRDQVIAELKVQLKDAQDLVTIEPDFPLPMPSWLNKEPEDDNGDYARGLRT